MYAFGIISKTFLILQKLIFYHFDNINQYPAMFVIILHIFVEFCQNVTYYVLDCDTSYHILLCNG